MQGITGGWARVTRLDMTQENSQCPSSLCLSPSFTRSCRICPAKAGNCSSQRCPVPIPYSKICGRIIDYQVGSPDAFSREHSNVFDGIRLTYGSFNLHIWSFIAALEENYLLPQSVCSCIKSKIIIFVTLVTGT